MSRVIACLIGLVACGLFIFAVRSALHPGEHCVRSEVQIIATYPFMAFISTNPALAMIPVFEKQRVCVEWTPDEAGR